MERTPLQDLLSKFEGVNRHGDTYQAKCPAHQDDRASLSIGVGKSGKILLYCHAGCTPESILAAVGKKWDSLFCDSPPTKSKPQIVQTYDYHDERGELIFQTVRYFPKDFRQRRPDGKGGYTYNLQGISPDLYRLPEVLKSDQIFIVEGEKDADNLAKLGIAATTSPMGAGKWKARYSRHLRGKQVAIFPDNDEPGRKHTESIAKGLQGIASSVKIIELPGLQEKSDVSDWLENGGSKERLLQLVDAAVPWVSKTDVAICRNGLPSPGISESFPLTDFGNAERFADQHHNNVRFCHTWEKWLIWSGKHWQVDEIAKICQLAKGTVRKIYAEAAQTEDDDKRKALSKHARSCELAGRIQAMLSLAQSEQTVAIIPNRLDVNPWLLNVLNGTLDLRSGKLTPHRRGDLITKIAPVNYDPAAAYPQKWFSFLDRIMAGSFGLIGYLQKLVGYCLSGDTREKCLTVLNGVGDNGKTIFTSTINGMLGDYAQETPVETLMIKRNESIPNDIAALKGARLVTASEGERGQRLAESLIKRLTGGDKISARFLHQEFFEFVPEFKILLSTNHKPVIRGSDNAIWNRIHLVPFGVTIPKSEQVPRTVMLEQLREEWPGILRWAVEGCLLWQNEGIAKPDEVAQATDDYRAGSDVIGGFISDCCTLHDLAKCRTADLYAAYVGWCGGNKEEPLKARTFGDILEEHGFKRRRVGARADRGFGGIGLNSDTDTQTLIASADAVFQVISSEKNTYRNMVKSASADVCVSAILTCSECANFQPNPTNSSFQGHCLGTPPDGDRSRFPKLEIDCPDFRERAES